MSTYVHELHHWKDAERYRRKHRKNIKEVSVRARNTGQKEIEKLQEKGYDVDSISNYAKEKLTDGNFDEAYTEYRTKRILEERIS